MNIHTCNYALQTQFVNPFAYQNKQIQYYSYANSFGLPFNRILSYVVISNPQPFGQIQGNMNHLKNTSELQQKSYSRNLEKQQDKVSITSLQHNRTISFLNENGKQHCRKLQKIKTQKQIDSHSKIIRCQDFKKMKKIKFIQDLDFTQNLQKKKIYKQNPNRNMYTNIGNKLITYISTSNKSIDILSKIYPEFTQVQIDEFYDYCWRLKKATPYYLNLKKILQVLTEELSDQDKKYKTIIRKLSNYYLRWILPLAILNSRKMSWSSRKLHLTGREKLLIIFTK